jgi:hypothetical protein
MAELLKDVNPYGVSAFSLFKDLNSDYAKHILSPPLVKHHSGGTVCRKGVER